jgi:hypothetical protein
MLPSFKGLGTPCVHSIQHYGVGSSSNDIATRTNALIEGRMGGCELPHGKERARLSFPFKCGLASI